MPRVISSVRALERPMPGGVLVACGVLVAMKEK
jgi:hypothetical protein